MYFSVFTIEASNKKNPDKIQELSVEEIESFNSQLEVYYGKQDRMQLSSLINLLISNANKNKDDSILIPKVSIDKINAEDDNGINAVWDYGWLKDKEQNQQPSYIQNYK